MEGSHLRGEVQNFYFWMNYPFAVCGSVLTYLLFKDHLGIKGPNVVRPVRY